MGAVAVASRLRSPAQEPIDSDAAKVNGGPVSSLRVCMVHYSPFEVDSRIQRQARALAERGDEVHCVCLEGPATLAFGAGAIHLHPVSAPKAGGGFTSYLSGNLRFLAGSFRKVSALHREQRFDLVEIHNMPDALTFAALLPKLRGAPVILNIHDTFPELFSTMFGRPEGHPLVRLVGLEERASCALADGLVFVTDEARERLRTRGVTKPRTRVVMNTPDERVFGETRPPEPLPVEGPLNLVYHGGLAPRFGVELLVRAVPRVAAEHSQVSLDVYGAARNAPIVDLAAKLAPHSVRVAPEPTPLEDIPAKLRRAHVGIVPTLEDEFTRLLLPVKLLEYVHMGLPAVVARLPVIERYFSDDEVSYFTAGDVESLVEAIERVLRDPAAATERAVRAQRRLVDIAWPRQRAGYLSLIDELAGVHANG